MFFFFDLKDKDRVPSFDEMMEPLLYALKDLGGQATVEELNRKTEELLSLPIEVLTVRHSPKSNLTEIEYRLTWTRSYLKKAGILENSQRHVWKFADGFDSDNLNIDVNEIKRQVRNERFKALNNPTLTNFESGLAFEKFVLSALAKYAKNQNKTLSSPSDMFFDAYLPQGIDDIDEPIDVLLKYNFTKNLKNSIEQINHLLSLSYSSADLLIIVSDSLPKSQKLDIFSRIAHPVGKLIDIWGYEDLTDRIGTEDSPYLVNPKKALLEDAIRVIPSPKETASQKSVLLAALKRAYQSQDVTLCLGAGVSMGAGIPLWNDLINKMLISMIAKKVAGKSLDKSSIAKLNALAFSNKEDSTLTQMRYIKTAFDEKEYIQLLHKALYGSNKINSHTALLNTIASLSAPRRNHIGVKSVITYNFDNLFEQQLLERNIDCNIVYKEEDEPSNNKLNVYHVHGYLPHNIGDSFVPDTEIIFSEEDYHRIYRDSFCWSNITQLTAFKNNTCVFIGCSLTDPNLRRLLDAVSKNKDRPKHFAFMKSKTFDSDTGNDKIMKLYSDIDRNIRDSYFRSIGINVIWVDDYSEIPALLDSLLE